MTNTVSEDCQKDLYRDLAICESLYLKRGQLYKELFKDVKISVISSLERGAFRGEEISEICRNIQISTKSLFII